MVDISFAKDIASMVKDVIVALAAVAASAVAVYGVNSWRRETQGKARFEVGRTLMLAAYRAREDIKNCRSPLIVAGEFPPELNWSTGSAEEQYKAQAHVYSTRWAPVRQAMEKFDAAVLDAEVVLGQKIKAPSEKLTTAARKLFVGIDVYLSDIRSGHQELDKETRASFRALISSLGSHDALGQEISFAVEELESAVVEDVRRDG